MDQQQLTKIRKNNNAELLNKLHYAKLSCGEMAQVLRHIHVHLEHLEIDTPKKEQTANDLLKVALLIEEWFA